MTSNSDLSNNTSSPPPYTPQNIGTKIDLKNDIKSSDAQQNLQEFPLKNALSLPIGNYPSVKNKKTAISFYPPNTLDILQAIHLIAILIFIITFIFYVIYKK